MEKKLLRALVSITLKKGNSLKYFPYPYCHTNIEVRAAVPYVQFQGFNPELAIYIYSFFLFDLPKIKI